MGYGGPTAPDEIMPFLRRVVEGKGVPDSRLQGVVGHYEAVGGRSPFNEQTQALADSLEHWLQQRGRQLPVVMGMRNWHPFLADTLARLKDDGRRHAAVIILAPHRSATSWDRYKEEALAAAAGGIDLSFVEPYFDDVHFIEANAARIEELGLDVDGEWPEEVPVVFTAHSVPVAMAEAGPYVQDVTATASRVADLLEIGRWEIAWQSRSGAPGTPWLEPDINDVLRRLGGEGVSKVVVQAIGFLSDHVEVLYDLDVEARATAASCGLELHRAGCVNGHPAFLDMLGERLIRLSGETL